MRYLVGIDNGGTAAKAAVFDEEGRQLAVSSVLVPAAPSRPGHAERDMDELWQINGQAIRNALRQSAVRPEEIAGVSLSGHGKGLYLVDGKGRPAYPGILSTDRRGLEYVQRWKADGTAAGVYEKTFQDIVMMQPVALLAWLRDHEPEVLERTRYIFAVKDYIRYRLTGQAFAEYTDFSGGNLINLSTQAYDGDLMALFGLEQCLEKLPPLCRSSDICGRVTPEAASFTGLPPGIPVAAGMFDVDACGIASGLSSPRELCMIAGTWSINEFLSPIPITNGTVSLNSIFCIPGYFLIEESSPTSAGNLEWLLHRLFGRERAQIEAQGQSIYELANRQVASVEPHDCGLVFLPFLNGSNENPLAKGAFVGLTAYHDQRHMLRAVYEGVVFSHLTHVRRLLVNRGKPDSIRLSGGAAHSTDWAQIFADALQIPVETTAGKELGCLGAAMAAGIAAGIYPDYPSAISRTVQITQTICPRSEYRAVYEDKYEAYRAIIQGLDGAWSCMN